ncbi:MAG: error-prone DNA polymerase [Phycisphaeraceae bacterium]|jgi:error-prone DNA polymerase|nr:error-prone DNA polymerase [Phycisphaeraceae bacterium]
MPDQEFKKTRPHPAKGPGQQAPGHQVRGADPRRGGDDGGAAPAPEFVELFVTTNFTFLTGASHPEEFVAAARAMGHSAAAVADVNTLAGVVRAHSAAKDAGVRVVIGSRIRMLDTQQSVLLLPTCVESYARLCRLLTLGKRRAPKGQCHLTMDDVIAHERGMLAVVMPGDQAAEDDERLEVLERELARWREVFDDDRLSMVLVRRFGPDDAREMARLERAAARAGVPVLASLDAHMHDPERRALQDVLTCIRRGCTIDDAGASLHAHRERTLKPADEVLRLFGGRRDLLARAVGVARRALAFSMDQLRYRYPDPDLPAGLSAAEHLASLAWAGARERYCTHRSPDGTAAPQSACARGGACSGGDDGGGGCACVPAKVARVLKNELALIEELRYENYFLTCREIVAFARSRGIRCQGRGGAANSAVCYCLGITEVDPSRFSLLFARFISRSRNEPPDIDIDFEHERREEVIQHIYERYGRTRAALTAEVISYRGRSAVRDVGKAMGLSGDTVDLLAREVEKWGGPPTDQRVREAGLDPATPALAMVLELSRTLAGFPRHLSQHVGGFVITQGELTDLVPVENAAMEDRTVLEWDKDDLDAMGMLKIDVLGLGMLTCVRKAAALVGSADPCAPARTPAVGRAGLPPDDPVVYDMICRADTVGVFQVESRAQMSMLPRLRPREFYDLVIEVAIVRPGPIQGGMVHPYLRRRTGEEPVTYPREEVRQVLGRTLGVPLFQEQAMQLAIVAAGFTPDEADALRKAMAAWKRKGDQMVRFGRKLIDGMLANGYPKEFAERCFEQVKGFSEYGFPESHAASFALLVYESCRLKRYHPAAFACALINSQPMGFYQPSQIVRDAREHGVSVRPVDVNHSDWDCTLEAAGAPNIGGVMPGLEVRGVAASAAAPPSRWGAEGAGGAGGAGGGPVQGPVLRLGMRLVRSLREDEARKLVAGVRRHGAMRSVLDLWRATGVSVATLRALAHADAFGSMGLDRQAALWQTRALRDHRLELFDPELIEGQEPERIDFDLTAAGTETEAEAGAAVLAAGGGGQSEVGQRGGGQSNSGQSGAGRGDDDGQDLLPGVRPGRQVLFDYHHTGLSLKAHPMSFLRPWLSARGAGLCGDVRDRKACPHGARVRLAGLVLVRQRPSTASGVVFITIEDESGVANLVLWSATFEKFRRAARLSTLLLIGGRVERKDDVVHVIVDDVRSLDELAPDLAQASRDFH